jgi:predicted ribosome quality control (RQC) complex YloA/Tae2 family protein
MGKGAAFGKGKVSECSILSCGIGCRIALGGIQALLDTQKVILELDPFGEIKMTYLEVAYRYQTPPGEAELRAIDSVREVYGIQRIQFNEKDRIVRTLFDASRLKAETVAKLLRQAGIDVQEQLVLT